MGKGGEYRTKLMLATRACRESGHREDSLPSMSPYDTMTREIMIGQANIKIGQGI